MQFIISGDLTASKLQEILNEWSINCRGRLENLWKYYSGKPAIKNFNYENTAITTKNSAHIDTNFAYLITSQYQGFNLGDGTKYTCSDDIINFLSYSDYHDKENTSMRNGLIFGVNYELIYIDSQKNVRFDEIDPRFGIAIHDDTLENGDLKAFVRLYCTEYINPLNQKWKVEVYDNHEVTVYKTTYNTMSSFTDLIFEDKYTHFFNQVPVVEFSINPEQRGIFENILSLIDGYDSILSGRVDNFNEFLDSYLVIKGMMVDEQIAAKLKKQRIINGDSTDFDVSFLTKETNNQEVDSLLNTIRDDIFMVSQCPDFTNQNFASSQSGVGLLYKLTGFLNVSKSILARFEKALRKRIELYQEIYKIKTGEDSFEKIGIVFNPNIPDNLTEIAQVVNRLRGIVSDDTLRSLIPFITSTEAEAEKVASEKKANAELYNFASLKEDDEDGLLENE